MPKSKRISLTDMRIAVAKECLLYNDFSKETITIITKAYLTQLKKDGREVIDWRYGNIPTQTQNATKVQFEIEKLKKNGTFNNTN